MDLSEDLLIEQVPETAQDAEELIAALLGHPALSDVSKEATVEEVEDLLKLERGEAFKVDVQRGDGSHIRNVVTPHDGTVEELERAVSTAAKAMPTLQRNINWTYVWSRYCLTCGGRRLQDPQARLRDVGVVPGGADLAFALRRRERTTRKRAATSRSTPRSAKKLKA